MCAARRAAPASTLPKPAAAAPLTTVHVSGQRRINRTIVRAIHVDARGGARALPTAVCRISAPGSPQPDLRSRPRRWSPDRQAGNRAAAARPHGAHATGDAHVDPDVTRATGWRAPHEPVSPHVAAALAHRLVNDPARVGELLHAEAKSGEFLLDRGRTAPRVDVALGVGVAGGPEEDNEGEGNGGRRGQPRVHTHRNLLQP
jgi:hypothetical protein